MRLQYAEFRKLIEAERPDVVFTQWPVDTHPDHRACSLLTYDALAAAGQEVRVVLLPRWTSASRRNASRPTDYVDVAATARRKRDACFAHESQNPGGGFWGQSREPMLRLRRHGEIATGGIGVPTGPRSRRTAGRSGRGHGVPVRAGVPHRDSADRAHDEPEPAETDACAWVVRRAARRGTRRECRNAAVGERRSSRRESSSAASAAGHAQPVHDQVGADRQCDDGNHPREEPCRTRSRRRGVGALGPWERRLTVAVSAAAERAVSELRTPFLITGVLVIPLSHCGQVAEIVVKRKAAREQFGMPRLET